MQFFDTHCHLQDERIKAQSSTIIEQAHHIGVCYFLCCGSTESDWDDVATIASAHPSVIPAFGLHPWYIGNRSETWRQKLEKLLSEFPDASVGEIGLDHRMDTYDAIDQVQVFQEQLACAASFNRPVSIHCRGAWGDLLSVISSAGGLQNGGALHSFSGSSELIKPLDRLGCSFSFSGSVTYTRNKRVKDALALVPLHKLLIETDTPDQSPFGHTGCNVPSTITMVHERVAHVRAMTTEDSAALLYKNSVQLFGKKL